ncbi:hypothetical protein ARMA_0987 [Ardenticatena maritima]|uniref:Uncharacterized protein n=1 Tax=Ardenticatena maritima TaxID=872965 RepID=A0A0M9UC55_9CHLR|nr:hypothetical protein ARMA_0987 [Ardenticatena maritima]
MPSSARMGPKYSQGGETMSELNTLLEETQARIFGILERL